MKETTTNDLFRVMNTTLGVVVGCAFLGALNTPIFALALAWCILKLIRL